jgi:hypothetical protein
MGGHSLNTFLRRYCNCIYINIINSIRHIIAGGTRLESVVCLKVLMGGRNAVRDISFRVVHTFTSIALYADFVVIYIF